MASVRVTTGDVSRLPGDRTGIVVNTFRLNKLIDEITGEALMPIMMESLIPARDDAFENWPFQTGASRDSIRIVPVEQEAHLARAALQVGGQELIMDSRNKSHKDYAPFIEFNGTATTRPGTLTRAFFSNDREMRRLIHEGVAGLIRDVML